MGNGAKLVDRKAHWLVAHLHEQISAGTFSEEDVFRLFMLLREYSASGSPLRECADFIAHREKDRGQVFDYLVRTKNKLEKLGTENTVLEIKPVFTVPQLVGSINSCLVKFNLAGLDAIRANQIFICTISLLQDVALVTRKGKRVGELTVAVSTAKVLLLGNVHIENRGVGVSFPALSATNDFKAVPGATMPITFEGVTWAACKDGVMSLTQKTAK